jgi:hypothetical protein
LAGLPKQAEGPTAAAAGPEQRGAGDLAPAERSVGEVTPLSPDRYRYQLTIGGSTLEKLRLAKDMLRHALPSGDDEAVLDRALTALIADLARKKFAAEEKARPSRRQAPGSRHVTASVKRAVWVRDLGRCAFVGTDGHRCRERAFVEFHHVRPYAVGGEASVENIQLRCRRHNGYEARVYFARDSAGEGSRLGRRAAGGAGRVRCPAARQASREQTRDRRLVPERVGAREEAIRPAEADGFRQAVLPAGAGASQQAVLRIRGETSWQAGLLLAQRGHDAG